jgi:hypothetical protein
MSVFLETNHLFLRAPDGGVEDVANMKAAGFGAIFCNVGDYPPGAWATVRTRASTHQVICGPWLRTSDESNEFSPTKLLHLIEVADRWNAPYIVNSETELKGSGSELTSYINQVCSGDWALSMEPIPFANVDWYPIKAPVLPQCFGPEFGGEKTAEVVELWHNYGVRCVVPTFGTYSEWQPSLYNLLEPFGLYTADDCGNNFAPWEGVGQLNPCEEAPVPVSSKIGSQDGIVASCNKLRDLDPTGTLLVKGADGKWPTIETLPQDNVGSWKAWDKLQRTLQILKDDHDTGAI